MASSLQVKTFLLQELRNYPMSQYTEALIIQQGISCEDLLAASMDPHKQTAFRAAWLLEHIVLNEPSLLQGFYLKFLDYLPIQHNWSCIRSYSKLLMLATERKSPIEHSEEQEEHIIEHSFRWLIAKDAPVASVVNCMDILYNLSSKHPWVKDELAAQIKFLLKTPTAALAGRGNRILKRILNS